MTVSAHGLVVDVSSLRRRFSISLKGATLPALVQMAEALGFAARAVRLEPTDFRYLRLPVVLHWNLNHFVVLVSISRQRGSPRYHINDPAVGRVTMNAQDFSDHFTGVALELSPTLGFRPAKQVERLKISQLWSRIVGLWPSLAQLLALSILLQLAALAAPFYMQSAIDSAYPAGDLDLLLLLALGFGGLAFITICVTWLRSLVLINVNNSLSFQMSSNLLQHLVKLPLSWFEKRQVGDIISRFTSTQPITTLLSDGLISGIIDGILASTTLALVFLYSPMLASISLGATVLYVVLRLSFVPALRSLNVGTIRAIAAESSTFIETMRGIFTIKASGNEQTRQRVWFRKKSDVVNAQTRLARLNAAFAAGQGLVLSAERVLFIYLGIRLAMKGEITLGSIFALQAYKQQFMDATARLVDQSVNLTLVKVHLSRISDIALSQVEPAPEAMSAPLSGPPVIELKNVWYKYGTNEPDVLRGVSIRIEPGQFVAIVGPSGGGKTTLLKIMMGLLPPTYGEVLVNGIRLSNFGPQNWRSQCGFVGQEDLLFAGSIADNIAFFDPDLDMSRVQASAVEACVAAEIEAMPLKYESAVGDMGSVLSSGQKQRILLARAFYRRPVAIFLDEVTAHLDAMSEGSVLAALAKCDATRVAIAHRPRALEIATRLLVVQDGTVREFAKSDSTVASASDKQ